MPKIATYKEVLEDAAKHRFGLSVKAHQHLRKTFDSLNELRIKRVKNPRYARKWIDKWKGFAEWSIANSFSLQSELELLRPHVVPFTKIVKWTEEDWRNGVVDRAREHEVVYSADENDWITDFEDYKWVRQDTLARRSAPPNLTPYGKRRLDNRREPRVLKAFGESKSVAAWAGDARSSVSDKAIKRRKKLGWSNEDAISLPRGTKPLS